MQFKRHDGDGRPELALASGFYFSESSRGGQIQLLSRPPNLEDTWVPKPIAVDPVVHRVIRGKPGKSMRH